MNVTVRNIEDKDRYAVELVTKRAFWNLFMPGCDEHYLVHRLWDDPCYLPELSLLAEADGRVVGAIMYTKSRIETENGDLGILTFGPLCVDPDCQRQGIGKTLLLESMRIAADKGYPAIFICGVPEYYPKFGFKTADVFGVTMPDGSNFSAFMRCELRDGALDGVSGKFFEAGVFDCDVHDPEYMKAVDEFDKGFPYKEKLRLPGQLF